MLFFCEPIRCPSRSILQRYSDFLSLSARTKGSRVFSTEQSFKIFFEPDQILHQIKPSSKHILQWLCPCPLCNLTYFSLSARTKGFGVFSSLNSFKIFFEPDHILRQIKPSSKPILQWRCLCFLVQFYLLKSFCENQRFWALFFFKFIQNLLRTRSHSSSNQTFFQTHSSMTLSLPPV